MSKRTREQLGVKEGDRIVLKGRVSFARLNKAVTGDALARENERRERMGMMRTKEFRSVTIENPEIVQGDGTPLAQFHSQEVYQSKSTSKPTMSFESKSLFPPSYGHMQEDGSIKEIPDPEKNPDQGQIVYLLITAFKSKGFANLGSTFDTIVFEKGDIQFYEGKGSNLAGFGQAMNMPVQSMTNAESAVREQVPVGAQMDQQGGFDQAPVGNQNHANQNNFGSFGQGPEQGQGGFDQAQTQEQGGFGQAPPEQNGTNNNPFGSFGVQEGSMPNQGSPFGNSGQRGKSPYA
ncbi:hypothetical protein HXA34_20050 [Salipaludibacillus agaradhaerens]|jgi:hypothetical protein|uniref:hypothetical protein n=1 Tax=Salipaludibacillus agaradhaerens TaxID=76935 RepID=UPI002151C88D|nr:hypothetical protein [Salipaludibacillus agaradhaerens]MCR6108584.1 hypothetical protein [Salipaludibacillus agaradhaerens]MCR6120613.1 hypothetical protein [Salipaludibacillus agaradhaerens]